jgi:hypothetical protein
MTFDPEIINKINWVVRHHGRWIEPLYSTLLQELLGNDPPGHWGSWRGGNNSNMITMADGRTFYLHGNVMTHTLDVRDRPRGPAVVVMKTRPDVIRWVKTL